MNKTALLAVVAVIAAAALVGSTLAATPAFAHHRHSGGTSQSNEGRASASGFGGNIAANVQVNAMVLG
jgi:hypothetical protein